MTHDTVRAMRWRDGALELLDQRLLPGASEYLRLTTAPAVAHAISDLVVRGAPAIGITAAYGVVLSTLQHAEVSGPEKSQRIAADVALLAAARPTAVNLCWALQRLQPLLEDVDAPDLSERCLGEAKQIHQQDIAANHQMGELGAAYIDSGSSVLTHCNTGSLATGGYGTALGVIRTAYRQGRIERIYADETRPWLQGARLTAWELQQDRIPADLIIDGAAAWLMAQEGIQWLIVGADRVAANGDVANKIGTYQAAVAARHHGVKVMVAIPSSTLDMDMPDGSQIPIERRQPDEVTAVLGQPIAPADCGAWNPVFDITPAALVDVLVTEKGALEHPDKDTIAALMAT